MKSKSDSTPVRATSLSAGMLLNPNISPSCSPALQPEALQALAAATEALLRAIQVLQGGHCGARATGASPSLLDLVNEFLETKARAGRSARYLQTIHMGLGQFLRGRTSLPAYQIDARLIETWLDRPSWSDRTRRNRLSELRTLFAFAVKRGYLPRDPAATVELREPEPEPVCVHTPEQVADVLKAALRIDPTVCRVLAIRYFAGLRTAEAGRLAESDLLISAGFVEVAAAKSKTRARRLVPIRPALAAWLEHTKARGGELPLRNEHRRLAAVVRESGVPWPHNVTRHSFCSYALAAFQNAGQTALEAGHSEVMLFAHYRAVVLPEAAERFWRVLPG